MDFCFSTIMDYIYFFLSSIFTYIISLMNAFSLSIVTFLFIIIFKKDISIILKEFSGFIQKLKTVKVGNTEFHQSSNSEDFNMKSSGYKGNGDYEIKSYISEHKYNEVMEVIQKEMSEMDLSKEFLCSSIANRNVALHFYNIYDYIYGSQISLLKFLASLKLKKAESDDLNKFYNEYLDKVNKDLSYYSTKEEYLNYLRVAELIEYEGDSVLLTDIGLDFVHWIYDRNHTPKLL